MAPWLRRVLLRAAAAVAGVVLGFFFVFGPLFTDGPRDPFALERIASFALSTGMYLVAGFLLGLVSPRDRLRATFLAAPSLVLALLYAARETNIAGLAVAYVVLTVAAAFVGVRLASLRKVQRA